MKEDQAIGDRKRFVCFGEILLRLGAARPSMLFQEKQLEASFCGAEANVAVALAGFGHDANMVTALPDNTIGDAPRRELRSFGVGMDGALVREGRLGLYFLEPGAMQRPSRIVYDRANSVFTQCGPQDFDWSRLLDGADWLFLSGITAALGDGPLNAMRAAIAEARKRGMRIGFDSNFRPTLWLGREDEAARILFELSSQADLLFAGRRAIAMMAGGRYDHADPAEGFAAAARTMFDRSPSLVWIAGSRRDVHSSDRQDYTVLLADRHGLTKSETIALEGIIDRIGTGDALAAAVLHGLSREMPAEEICRFALAAAKWSHSIKGDFLRARASDIAGLAGAASDVTR